MASAARSTLVAARFLLFEGLSEKADLLLQKFHEDAIELKAPGLELPYRGEKAPEFSHGDESLSNSAPVEIVNRRLRINEQAL